MNKARARLLVAEDIEETFSRLSGLPPRIALSYQFRGISWNWALYQAVRVASRDIALPLPCALSCTRLRVPPVALHVSQLISWIL